MICPVCNREVSRLRNTGKVVYDGRKATLEYCCDECMEKVERNEKK